MYTYYRANYQKMTSNLKEINPKKQLGVYNQMYANMLFLCYFVSFVQCMNILWKHD